MEILHPFFSNKRLRNSSIELYRIIATFTVLIVHFNGWFVGGMPEKYDVSNPTIFRTGQMIIEAASCICVNLFLIISGYFGLRLKIITIIRLCMLLVLIYVSLYFLGVLIGDSFSVKSLFGRLYIISNAGYFIQCYLMLMFLSPLLNSFIEIYGKRVLSWTLVFIFIEFWFGCVRDIDNFGFNKGYSIIHFTLMYMVARCIALYKDNMLKFSRIYWTVGYVVSTSVICLMYILGISYTFHYSNPMVITSTICSFMSFLSKAYYNKFIH